MTAGLLPYPAYKPSGVPWLGDVPEHWEVRRLKTSCYESNRCSNTLLLHTTKRTDPNTSSSTWHIGLPTEHSCDL